MGMRPLVQFAQGLVVVGIGLARVWHRLEWLGARSSKVPKCDGVGDGGD